MKGVNLLMIVESTAFRNEIYELQAGVYRLYAVLAALLIFPLAGKFTEGHEI